MPAETGKTFNQNAKLKSKRGFDLYKIPCISDDSGICVSALNNEPGVNSKRFLEKFKSKKQAFKYIINKTNASKNTVSIFKTSICLTTKLGQYIIFEGSVSGNISSFPKGKNGFGYDPIFIPKNFKKTFAEMKNKEKNLISHRGIAINKLINFVTI